MSVRRLAADAIQPKAFAFTPENQAWARTVIAKYPAGRQASAVIPLLWRAQEQHDYWLPKAAIDSGDWATVERLSREALALLDTH